MLCTKEELDQAYGEALSFFKKNQHMLDLDRERDAIEIIKCRGDNIGDTEAKMILGKLRGIGKMYFYSSLYRAVQHQRPGKIPLITEQPDPG